MFLFLFLLVKLMSGVALSCLVRLPAQHRHYNFYRTLNLKIFFYEEKMFFRLLLDHNGFPSFHRFPSHCDMALWLRGS